MCKSFTEKVKIQKVRDARRMQALALSRHTQGHTATTRPVLKCRGGAARRRRLGGRARPHERRAGGSGGCLGGGRCCLLRYSLDASIAWAEVQRSLDCGDDRSGSIRMAGLSYTVSSLVYLGPQFVLYLTKV